MNLGGVIHLNKTGLCMILGAFFIFCLYMFTSSTPTENLPSFRSKIDLGQLLRVALTAAKNGGAEVVATKDNLKIQSKGLTNEGLKDSVTTADYLSHCAILATLRHHYLGLTIISEEAKTECDKSQKVDFSLADEEFYKPLQTQWVNASDVTVWIDPLDATLEYTEKLYKYVTTMVCVAVKGVPIIGVIHRPFSKKTSWAWAGQAKSPDLNPPDDVQHDKVKIIISRSHSGQIKQVLNKAMPDNEIFIAAGAGYKALEVATGAVDAYLHITAIKKWDICAGNAIINALGGKMTTKFGEFIDYKDLTNVQNEKGLVATLKNHDYFVGKL